MESQCEMILMYLKTHVGITDNQARDLYGINRLSGRIHDLRNRGHNIASVWCEGTNRFNKPIRFVQYRLVKRNEQ